MMIGHFHKGFVLFLFEWFDELDFSDIEKHTETNPLRLMSDLSFLIHDHQRSILVLDPYLWS